MENKTYEGKPCLACGLNLRYIKSEACAICSRKRQAKKRKEKPEIIAADHDHKTGLFRDFLCHSCNFIIGHVEKYGLSQSPDIKTYLAKFSGS